MQIDTVLNFLKRPIVMTALGVLVGLLLGLLLGLIIGWSTPAQADPSTLSPELQEDYLRMTVDSFRVNADLDLAAARWTRLGPNRSELLAKVNANPGDLNVGALEAFNSLVNEVEAAAAANGGSTGATGNTNLFLLGAIVVLVIAFVGGGIYYLPRLAALFAKSGGGEPTVTMQAVEASRNAEKTDFEGLGLAPPITQTMSTYMLGDDLYDESFSIDTQGGEFLGEYGVGVSETVGVGEPKKVAALEVWLFDKNDIKTATKVLMSEHAFNDPNIRGRLEPKGELVVVEPHKQVILETETLQLLATVVDIQYGQGPLPANSYFERLTLELAIWPKGG